MYKQHQIVDIDRTSIVTVLQSWKSIGNTNTVLALLPEAERDNVSLLQEVFHELDVKLYGAIFPAILSLAGFQKHGVLLILLAEDHVAFLVDDLQREGVVELTRKIESAMGPQPLEDGVGTVFIMFDAMTSNIGTLLEELHASVIHKPRYIGVNAGSETFQPIECLFDGSRIVQGGALGFYFPRKLNSAVHHAYEKSKSEWRATSTAGNKIATIDGRPAFEVYREIIYNEYGVNLNQQNFYELAVHFPFGLVTAMDVLVRIPVGLNKENEIICVGEIPPNSILRLLRAPELIESECAQNIGTTLKASAGKVNVNSLLTFYCAGRAMHFGEHAKDELTLIPISTGKEEVFGALTLGEIDTQADFEYPRFHNAAIVCIAADN